MVRYFRSGAFSLVLVVLTACSKQEGAAVPVAPVTSPQAIPHTATTTQALTPEQAAQLMELQAQQLLLMQQLQLQQQMFDQTLQTYKQANAAIDKSMHIQSQTLACHIADNCEVRVIPKDRP